MTIAKENRFEELKALLDAELWDDARKLIASGADINSTTDRWITLFGYYDIPAPLTLLMYYTVYQGLPQMRFLLSEGADLSRTCCCGETALMKAASAGVIEPMKLLLEYGAAIGIKVKNCDGNSALFLLEEHGTAAMMQLLLDAGASLDERAEDESTLLHYAVMNNNADLVKGCLRAGIDLYVKDTLCNETALEMAITDRQIYMQRLLRVAYRKTKLKSQPR